MRRYALWCLPLAGLLGLPTLGQAAPARWTPRPATYGTIVESDVRVTMSDGVRLTVDIVRPAVEGEPAPGRFPVLVTQTPYNKLSGPMAFRSDYLVTRGYVQVLAEVRGTGSSEGNWRSFDDREQKDGKELVEWAASRQRPWSDGRVGLHGTSYGAINQLFTAAQQPKGLRAIFPIVPSADTYRDIVASGGQVNTSFIPLWLGLVTSLGMLPPTYTGDDPVGAATTLASHAGNTASFQVATVASATTGGDIAYDGPFHRTRSPIEVIHRVTVPTFIVGGWFDLFQRGEPLLYERLRAQGTPTRLVMGPWTHIAAGDGAGLVESGWPSLDELELRWFDRYVRGVPDRALDRDIPQVVYNQLGDTKFRAATSWPPASTRYRALPLAGTSMPGAPGTLGIPAAAGSAPDLLLWSPATGACTRSTGQWTAGGASALPCDGDNRLNDAAGLAYDLPLARDTFLAGPISARLFVSTNGRDSLLTARVEDVAPDGTASQISAGWQVLSLRALDVAKSTKRDGFVVRPWHPFTRESQRPMTSGEISEVYVEIFPTAAVLKAGHSLRLSIQTSDAPHLSAPVPQLASSVAGLISIHHDPAHPSALIVPFAR